MESKPKPKRYGVICCGVLEWRFRAAAEKSQHDVEISVLPAGLHADPGRLRTELQDAIDRMDEEVRPDGIILGYGLCGRGVAEIAARRAPLAIVRGEDCTAILLGSQQKYREQFLRYPGTFYFSHGWVHARGRGGFSTAENSSLYDPHLAELARRYGEEHARYISEFRESWKRNYERAAAIVFSDDPEPADYREKSAALADELGWEHEDIRGDEHLFLDLVEGRWMRPEILVVQPGEKIVPAPGVETLNAGQDVGASFRDALARFRAEKPSHRPSRAGVGLGIDAGGTYTDSVLYDFDGRKVLSKSKAPTTHEDLIRGVRASVDGLDKALLPKVSRVALSTTLATNAIVEGRGRPVGLLLMGVEPDDLDKFRFVHKRLIPGRLSIEGMELAPLDEEAARRAARELASEGVEAFAVSAYAAVVDPAHELRVARIANEETGLPVVCGHELARSLNLYHRGATAALNARLIPLIKELIRSVKETLASHGIDAPLMVVCGDGSQMLDRYAEVFPVEQILSGPAASVVGALELSGRRDAVVADMGGTTLDVAVIRDGEPLLDEEGARVGDFQTCVRAMRIHTIGLGCDSRVQLREWPKIAVGPRRVVPVCALAVQYPQVAGRLRALAGAMHLDAPGAEPADFVALGGPRCGEGLSEREAAVLRALKDGPMRLVDLANAVGAPSPSLVPLERLEKRGAVIRAGLTPTDILHAQGVCQHFNGSAAAVAVNLACDWVQASADEVIAAVRRDIRMSLARELLAATLAEEEDWDPSESSAQFMVGRLFSDDFSGPHISLRLGKPVVPIGAPVHAFFPELADPLGTEVFLPEHADVANAVGAIAGDVLLSEQVRIVAASDGAFHVQSRLESRKLFKLEDALTEAERLIRRALREKAERNALGEAEPEFEVCESVPDTPQGPVFLGVTLTGKLRA